MARAVSINLRTKVRGNGSAANMGPRSPRCQVAEPRWGQDPCSRCPPVLRQRGSPSDVLYSAVYRIRADFPETPCEGQVRFPVTARNGSVEAPVGTCGPGWVYGPTGNGTLSGRAAEQQRGPAGEDPRAGQLSPRGGDGHSVPGAPPDAQPTAGPPQGGRRLSPQRLPAPVWSSGPRWRWWRKVQGPLGAPAGRARVGVPRAPATRRARLRTDERISSTSLSPLHAVSASTK